MSSFDQAVEVVLEHEGGFVNNVHDPGGATKYGVSLRFLKGLRGIELDLDGDGDVDAQDVRAMTREQAVNFYSALWWEPAGFGDIADQRCATKMFDVAVNVGSRRADRLAFMACDLIIGDTSRPPIATINKMDPTTWLKNMCFEQRRFYCHLVAEKPALEEFRAGWYVRAAWPFHPAALGGIS